MKTIITNQAFHDKTCLFIYFKKELFGHDMSISIIQDAPIILNFKEKIKNYSFVKLEKRKSKRKSNAYYYIVKDVIVNNLVPLDKYAFVKDRDSGKINAYKNKRHAYYKNRPENIVYSNKSSERLIEERRKEIKEYNKRYREMVEPVFYNVYSFSCSYGKHPHSPYWKDVNEQMFKINVYEKELTNNFIRAEHISFSFTSIDHLEKEIMGKRVIKNAKHVNLYSRVCGKPIYRGKNTSFGIYGGHIKDNSKVPFFYAVDEGAYYSLYPIIHKEDKDNFNEIFGGDGNISNIHFKNYSDDLLIVDYEVYDQNLFYFLYYLLIFLFIYIFISL